MIALRAGEWSAEVLPDLGGAIGRLDWRGRPVFRPAPAVPTSPLESACFPLLPYANRIDRGRFAWRGREVTLNPTPGFEPHALHGTGWLRRWSVREADGTSVALGLTTPAGDWPWSWRAEQLVTLVDSGLRIDLSLTNTDVEPMPAGLGLHPYFATTPADRIGLSAPSVWLAPDLIPERLDDASAILDWSGGVARAAAPFVDHAYEGWTGRAEVIGPDRVVTLTSDVSRLHVYAPPGASFVCLEPVTHRPNGLNAPEGEDAGMRVLAPGQTLRLSMTVTAQAAQ